MEYKKLIKKHNDILEFRKTPYNERGYIEAFLKLAEKKVKNISLKQHENISIKNNYYTYFDTTTNMETRQITEIKVYKLILNPMRANTEDSTMVAVAYEKQKLINWYNSLLTTPYTDEGLPSFEVHGSSHKWRKSFIRGSELEWFNPCYSDFNSSNFGHGISDEWVTEKAIQNCKIKFII